ncbi:MAG TPA: hypothetical protein EYN30_03790 [Candidatus Poseidoniales archaeon]|jgi:hypothetical protein|nr:hypothetical protein [Candidatus Poseidoniales archaeon]HIB23889.1 hypothetical protein [Candidatus Poseidoniales archaeon]HIB41014.1 hypothetical protein [Candidatus Poseidoniales archaeon]HIO24381.1 hypothetical protein [Candidatus Poseidoniales archaeon]HIO57782.1 hypothetical protein [Candidatus Poseidoniales archaeon]
MDNWEFLTLTFVLITGIGISRLLISFGTMVEARAILKPEKRPRFHWLLLTWMFVTVDVIALSWLMFYKWNLLYEDPRAVLSPLTTLLLLGLASSFYIIMELLSPEISEEGDLDMKEHFWAVRQSLAIWIFASRLFMLLFYMSISNDIEQSESLLKISETYPVMRFIGFNVIWMVIAAGLYFGSTQLSQTVLASLSLIVVFGMIIAMPTFSMSIDDPDFDGVYFNADICPDSDQYFWEEVDVNGCTFSQYDVDGDGDIDNDDDGVFDLLDSCPETDISASVDEQGCPIEG